MQKRLHAGAKFCGVVHGLFIALMPTVLMAAEWAAQPSVRLSQGYNSNVQLTLQPHNSVVSSMVSPKLDLSASTDVLQVMGSVEAIQQRFSGNSSLNKDDRLYNLITSYKTERSVWQLAGKASKNSVLANEMINTNTGLVDVQKFYDEHSINPSWTWAVNELTQLQLSYVFDNVSYVNGTNVGLNDYSSRTASLQLTRQMDPQDTVFFTAGYSAFHVPATTFGSKSITYQAGMTRTFSETTRGTLSAGTRKTSSEQDSFQIAGYQFCLVSLGLTCAVYTKATFFSKQSSSVFNGSLETQFQITQLNVSFSRAFDPSAFGGQVQTDSLNATISRQLTEKLTGYLTVSNYAYRSEAGNTRGDNRHLYAIGPNLRWMWAREWYTDLTYQYQHLKRATEDRPVSSRAAFLMLRYEWPRMSLSR